MGAAVSYHGEVGAVWGKTAGNELAGQLHWEVLDGLVGVQRRVQHCELLLQDDQELPVRAVFKILD